uniref:DOMON domain-containing protein n=1 Tax=Panagrellus redivivus TaxID=6233 RepID=A0A7E4UPN4_PANRE
MRIWLAGILLLIHQASSSDTCNVKEWERTCPLLRYKLYRKYYYEISLTEEELTVEDVPTVHPHSELSDEDFEKYALTIAVPADSDPIQFTLEHNTYGKKRCPNDFKRIGDDIYNMEDQWCLCYEDMFENEEERFGMYKHINFKGKNYFCGRNYSMLCLRVNNVKEWVYMLNPAIGTKINPVYHGNESTPYAFYASKILYHSGGHLMHPFAIYELGDDPKYAILNMTVFSHDQGRLLINYTASTKFPAPKRRHVKDDITGESLTTIRVMPMRYRTSKKKEAFEFYRACLVKWHFPHAILYYRYDTPPPPSKVKPSVSAERFHAAESFRPQKIVKPKVVHEKTSLSTTTTSTGSAVFPLLGIFLPLGIRTPFAWLFAPLMLALPVMTDNVTAPPPGEPTPEPNYEKYQLKTSAYKYDYNYEGSTFVIRQKYTGFSLNSVTKHEFDQHSATLILPENGTVSLNMAHESHNAENDVCTLWDDGKLGNARKTEHQSCLCYEDNLESENERFNVLMSSRKDTIYFCGHGFSMICIRAKYYLFNSAISPLEAHEIITLYNDTLPAIFYRGKKTDQDLFQFKFKTQEDDKVIKLKFTTAYDRGGGYITTGDDVFDTEINVPAPKIRQITDPRTGRVVNTIRVLPVQYQYPRTCTDVMLCPQTPNLRCYVTWRFENCRLYNHKPPEWTHSVNGVGTKDVKQFQEREPRPMDVVFPEVVIVDAEDTDEESRAPGMAERTVLVIFMFLCTYLIPLY